MASREMLTIGHSNHDEQRFVELLAEAGVEMLCDVRVSPRSRNPHFNRAALEARLEAEGIAYLHLGEELGGRRKPAPDSPNTAWEDGAFRGYADHMARPEFAAGIARLEEAVGARRGAIMCAEGDWRRCHRRLIADALLLRDWQVTHLGGDGTTEVHTLTAGTIVEGSRITYPAPQTSLGV